MNKICDCCGRTDAILHSDSRHQICNICYQRSYTRCSVCHTMIHREDAYRENERVYCFSCYSSLFQYIHPHDYKPTPIFYGCIPRYFGVELELDYGGHSDETARILLNTVNTDAEYIYIKIDHSLQNGLEVVTHPMTLQYHQSCFPWQKLMNIASALGYHADDAPTCGLHIHTNRSSLGNTTAKQKTTIERILFLLQARWKELFALSRHGMDSSVRDAWSKPLPDDLNTLRNPAIGLTNLDTVEFRFFQSTLHAERLFAALQTVDRICELSLSYADDI